MKDDAILDTLASYFGIAPSFRDLAGVDRPTSRETKLALLSANGVDTNSQASLENELDRLAQKNAERLGPEEHIVEAQVPSSIPISSPAEWSVSLEQGQHSTNSLQGRARSNIEIPPLPAGIHTLFLSGRNSTQSVTLIAAPNRAPSVNDRAKNSKIWGINAALYGLHSAHSRELGDYEDLAMACEEVASLGASFLGINPVHSIGWAEKQIISPYSPSHRGFLNTDHIHLHARNERAARPQERSELIDYTAHRLAHKVELENAFAEFQSAASDENRSRFLAFKDEEGASLHNFAVFEALSEDYGSDWRSWPNRFQTATDEAVSNFAKERADRIEFHIWLQWVADKQLTHAQSRAKNAGMPIGLYLDLAVGARRGGAETWCESSVVAKGVSIGAPPDHLSPAGQNWDLAAFAPSQLTKTQYSTFRSILRHALRHAGILRIDHVLGLNRSFWIPDNGAPGGYVRQPFEALLAIVAIEAEKHGTIIVGEDLGLVPEGLRKRLHERGLYSYSVLQYEKDENGSFKHTDQLQRNSLTCFSTHDTPTLHGYLQQRDIDWWRQLDWIDDTTETNLRNTRHEEIAELLASDIGEISIGKQLTFDRLSSAVHGALADSPATIISVQLDDALGAIEAQNLPGTIDEHLNWQRRTSIPVELFATNSGLVNIAKQMHDAKRSVLKRKEK